MIILQVRRALSFFACFEPKLPRYILCEGFKVDSALLRSEAYELELNDWRGDCVNHALELAQRRLYHIRALLSN